MGAVNFHREFLSEFARIVAPLDEFKSIKKIDGQISKLEHLKD
jgi:hypothetical protein